MNSSSAPVLSTETRYFAYKLGYISRFKIEREARKAEPRLHKLVGHCSLFDQARKYIIEHNEPEDLVDTEAADKLSHEDSDDEIEAGFEHIESVAETPLSSQHSRQQGYQRRAVVVVRATEVPSGHIDDDLKWDDDDLEWDHDDDSDSTKTDDDEDDEDDSWSDSTCADDYDDGHPDRKVLELYPAPPSKHLHQNDDLLLWSQQPQVLTQGQADSLLVEAFA